VTTAGGEWRAVRGLANAGTGELLPGSEGLARGRMGVGAGIFAVEI